MSLPDSATMKVGSASRTPSRGSWDDTRSRSTAAKSSARAGRRCGAAALIGYGWLADMSIMG